MLRFVLTIHGGELKQKKKAESPERNYLKILLRKKEAVNTSRNFTGHLKKIC